jgi:hypothetical protein
MDKLIKQSFDIFKILFEIHIKTKTTDRLFHEDSPQFYEFALSVFHKVYERAIDLDLVDTIDCKEARKKNLDNLIILEKAINDQIAKKNSNGMDNLLRGLADEIEDKI